MKDVQLTLTAVVTGLCIFLGIPLLVWGVTDVAGFFTSPGRILYAVMTLVLQIFGALYHPRAGRNNQDAKQGIERRRVDLWLIQILSVAVVVAAPLSDRHAVFTAGLGEWVRLSGALMMAPGFILMLVAEKYLGRQFSVEVTVQRDHRLVTSGPYQYIRHPRYLGILAFFLGISMIFQSIAAVCCVLALGLVLMWRIAAEEALMRQEFGSVWDMYCTKSWRIIPFVF